MSILKVAQSTLPTRHGIFDIHIYRDSETRHEHIVLTTGTPRSGCLARVHSECATGDIFGSLRCDCGEQLVISLRAIGRAGEGVIIRVRGHEGRGIGLQHKIAAYALQDLGLDTAQANHHLGFPTDVRRYDAAVAILRDLGLHSVRLMSNSPDKIQALETGGIRVTERVPIWTQANVHNLRYLQTKRTVMGHYAQADAGQDNTGSSDIDCGASAAIAPESPRHGEGRP